MNNKQVDVLNISIWKWKKVKAAYRKYIGNPYQYFSSEDRCRAASYLNHFNDEFNVPKFDKLRVNSKTAILEINWCNQSF
jgi:hypothetical protein